MFKSKTLKTLLSTLFLSLIIIHPAKAATYKVLPGDSLYKIGKFFNVSYTTIIKNNDLTNVTIYPGQALNIPCQTYTVKSGDSLFLISRKIDISLDSLRRANNKWDNNIYPGQTLNIPGKTSSVVETKQPAGVIPYTSEDVNLLARLITAEAENQPYSAKVAVGAVVINRVQDSRFPKTIKSVIYQVDGGHYQFTPVLNGFINKPASADALKAANEALHGSDPSKGALYYFDDSTKNQWLWSKTISARIGRMVFTYFN